MRFFTLLCFVALTLGAGVATAQTMQRMTLRGVAHELAVPPGWTAHISAAGAELSPPAGPGRRLKVAVVGTEHVGGGDARQILDKLPREPFTVPRSTIRQWRPAADAPTPAQASHLGRPLHRREPG